MKSIGTILVTLILVSGLATVEILAENHQIEVLRTVQINGVKLKPGTYRISLNGDKMAELYKGRRLVTKAVVETAPLAGSTPNSISQSSSGQLLEIRLNDQKVVFVDSPETRRNAR